MTYIAIKLKGLDYFMWFEKPKFSETEGHVVAINGWGKRGEHISILETPTSEILCRFESSSLQYSY